MMLENIYKNALYVSIMALFCLILFPSLVLPRASFSHSENSHIHYKATFDDEPYIDIGVHKIGKISLTVSNQGHFGTGFSNILTDPLFGGQAPSCTYPYPGRQSYLFAGSFWIGAVVGRDTLVSVGADGWHDTKELWPDPFPKGKVVYRSITGVNASQAVSEQDYIAVYTDTVTNPQHVTSDSYDNRPHMPLNIEVTQRSYAWSYEYAEDFVLFDYSIKNIGSKILEEVYMGFYVDGDVNYGSTGEGHDDDICGFKQTIPSNQGCGFIDTINIAWIADNDGKGLASDPCIGNQFDERSYPLTALTGMRVVRTPSDSLTYSFNWWVSNSSNEYDFGPRKAETADDRFRDFGGFLGTPEGDKNKYYVMRHKEFDYDQLFSAIDHTDDGWLPVDPRAANFANGYDTRYLLSFGPFELAPGEVLPISFAYIAGDSFHTNCEAFDNMFVAEDPEPFYNQLNFSDLGKNAMWASWLYDNPGIDTDGNETFGKFRVCCEESTLVVDTIATEDSTYYEYDWIYICDTVFYAGDGTPDFRGATPPLPPELWQRNLAGDTIRARVYPSLDANGFGNLRIRWNGVRSETTPDFFSGEYDFEGYRVYLSETASKPDFVLHATYDIEDYNKRIWNNLRHRWELHDSPYRIEELRAIYGFSENIDPLMYTLESPFYYGDSIFYFTSQDWNFSVLDNPRHIHKVYPDQSPPTTLNLDSTMVLYPEELTEDGFYKYYEYEFEIENLLPSRLYYISVTAFDYGSPGHDLASLENSIMSNMVAEYAQNDNSAVEENGLNVVVYPNPYRYDGQYRDAGFEGIDYIDSIFGGQIVRQEGIINDRTQLIHFTNLPPECIIRIFSIDGDLIREIEHKYPKDSPRSMHEHWDLITRNTQTIVSGIYYWTVESKFGNQIGKLVIIK